MSWCAREYGNQLVYLHKPYLRTTLSSSPRAVCTGGLDSRDLTTGLFCISFLRKGEVLAHVGLHHNLKDLKKPILGGWANLELVNRRLKRDPGNSGLSWNETGCSPPKGYFSDMSLPRTLQRYPEYPFSGDWVKFDPNEALGRSLGPSVGHMILLTTGGIVKPLIETRSVPVFLN